LKNRKVTLESFLRYKNSDVLERYLKDFGGTRKEARAVFGEMLKWFYLNARAIAASSRQEPVQCVITSDLAKIDDMWHTFLLFTWDYSQFCERYFGYFFHHLPANGREPKVSPLESKRQRRRFYEHVYDVLGENTFRQWFMNGRFKRNGANLKKRRTHR
jgi:hypothetical protein